MKQRTLTLALFILILTLALSSCMNIGGTGGAQGGADNGGSGGENNGSGGEDNGGEGEDYIFSNNSTLTIVIPEGEVSEENKTLIAAAMKGLNDYTLSDGRDEPNAHEIVFGRSDREVSKKAYKYLERQEYESEEFCGYVFYSDGSSLAIAYSKDVLDTGIAEDAAVAAFIEKYTDERELVLPRGVCENEVFSLVEYQRERDAASINAAWEKRYSQMLSVTENESEAQAIFNSIKSLYSLYSSNLASWMCDLYDPETGGFYYSNSARNTDGFLPDLESTIQMHGLIRNSGISGGMAIEDFLPDEMIAVTVKWIRSLQDPVSGYFYHPQWGKAATDVNISRRGRDLGWATTMLKTFGSSPIYDTPNGFEGDGIIPASHLTSHLTSSGKEISLSAVILASDSDAGVAEHLLNEQNFRDYLSTLKIKTGSYGVGNTLESQATEIVERDKVLAKRGESYRLTDILCEWLTENQNKKTGLWQADGATDYYAVNGLLKIGSTYTKLGKEIPLATLACQAALDCAMSDAEPEHVCDVLNPLYALTILFENISLHSGADAEEKTAEFRSALLSGAVRLITVTEDKLKLFRKDDGSFSYYPDNSAESSMGMPTAVSGTNEGDVNATMICVTSIPGHISTLLGFSRPQIFFTADTYAFTLRLMELGSIIKDRRNDFRDDATGNLYRAYGGECYEISTARGLKSLVRADYYVQYETTKDYYHSASQAAQKQEFLNMQTDEEGSTFLEYGKAKDTGYYRGIYLRSSASAGTGAFVFETDLRINEVSEAALKRITSSRLPYLLEIKLAKVSVLTAGEVNVNECFETIGRIYVTTDDKGGYQYRLGPAVPAYLYSEEILSAPMELHEWNNIAVELYSNGNAKYYFNNKYFCTYRVLDDPQVFYSPDGVRVAFNSDATESSVHIDMTLVGRINKTYSKGDNYHDANSYEFKAGEYYEAFGGFDYSSQQKSDTISLFRASWYAQWGETLESERMQNPKHRREGFAVRDFTYPSGAIERVVEYAKGSYPDYYNGFYYSLHSDAAKGSVYVFETDFRLGTVSGETLSNLKSDSCLLDITLADFVTTSSGDFDRNISIAKIAGIYLSKNENGNYVYHLTNRREGSADGGFGLAIPAGAWCTLTVEVYPDGVAKYYVNGIPMGDRALGVSPESLKEADVLRISLAEKVIRSSVLLDNTFFGKVDKTYLESEDYQPSGDEFEDWPSDLDVFPDNQSVLTFEGGKLPGTVTKNLVTAGAELAVKDMIRGEGQTKAMVFTTKPGGNDYMNIRYTVTADSFNAVSFETDILIVPNVSSAQFAIEPLNAASQRAFRLIVTAEQNGSVTVYATGLPTVTLGKTGEWIHLRIDYMLTDNDYDGDGTSDVLYRLYAGEDEALLATCYASYDARRISARDIATYRFFTFNDTDADICLDNVMMAMTTMTADPAPEPEPDPEPDPDEPALPPEEPEVYPDSPAGPGHTEGEDLFDKDGWTVLPTVTPSEPDEPATPPEREPDGSEGPGHTAGESIFDGDGWTA